MSETLRSEGLPLPLWIINNPHALVLVLIHNTIKLQLIFIKRSFKITHSSAFLGKIFPQYPLRGYDSENILALRVFLTPVLKPTLRHYASCSGSASVLVCKYVSRPRHHTTHKIHVILALKLLSQARHRPEDSIMQCRLATLVDSRSMYFPFYVRFCLPIGLMWNQTSLFWFWAVYYGSRILHHSPTHALKRLAFD